MSKVSSRRRLQQTYSLVILHERERVKKTVLQGVAFDRAMDDARCFNRAQSLFDCGYTAIVVAEGAGEQIEDDVAD